MMSRKLSPDTLRNREELLGEISRAGHEKRSCNSFPKWVLSHVSHCHAPYSLSCCHQAGKTKKRLNLQGKTQLESECECDFPQTIRPRLVLQSASFIGYILPFGMLSLSNILIQCSNLRVLHMEINRPSKNENTDSQWKPLNQVSVLHK